MRAMGVDPKVYKDGSAEQHRKSADGKSKVHPTM